MAQKFDLMGGLIKSQVRLWVSSSFIYLFKFYFPALFDSIVHDVCISILYLSKFVVSRQLHISKETVRIPIKIHIEWAKKRYKEDT